MIKVELKISGPEAPPVIETMAWISIRIMDDLGFRKLSSKPIHNTDGSITFKEEFKLGGYDADIPTDLSQPDANPQDITPVKNSP